MKALRHPSSSTPSPFPAHRQRSSLPGPFERFANHGSRLVALNIRARRIEVNRILMQILMRLHERKLIVNGNTRGLDERAGDAIARLNPWIRRVLRIGAHGRGAGQISLPPLSASARTARRYAGKAVLYWASV